MADLKTCGHCRVAKDRSEFGAARNRKDGLYNFCKPCQDEAGRRNYQKHRAKILAWTSEYNKRPAVVERRKAYNKRSYAENRDRELANAKEWARQNRERRRAYVREWNVANREKVRAYQGNHKALKRKAGRASVTAAAWRLIKLAFRNRCVYCGREMQRLEQDHVVALSRGGDHLPDNIVPACRHCNATKLNNVAPPFWWTKSA